jgi:hypothetical protein
VQYAKQLCDLKQGFLICDEGTLVGVYLPACVRTRLRCSRGKLFTYYTCTPAHACMWVRASSSLPCTCLVAFGRCRVEGVMVLLFCHRYDGCTVSSTPFIRKSLWYGGELIIVVVCSLVPLPLPLQATA